ncbi:glycosyltransferase involved in cell wall biosynthesis [Cricetibacter osteomyelitidis]|uniref:Glycosyltransferase involved in cell wall biosynthesis n=1 Tax=Cricetibacter osteomyelitidis TaxID=1521931 RepID=A0A4V2T1V6_9PAST|nr:glycosyltransferase family 4 protein [Cricetibacter osteomyelitidis]TCP95023.1 glycosyltransferase involved in cell wall biosynthesis [Cricetibacter osteomyelitidis]
MKFIHSLKEINRYRKGLKLLSYEKNSFINAIKLLRQEYHKSDNSFEKVLNILHNCLENKSLILSKDKQYPIRKNSVKNTNNSLSVQIYFLGFHTGGGEIFPIHLANKLYELGINVSVVVLDLDKINNDIYNKLNQDIPIYHIYHILNNKKFFSEHHVDIIHSHIIAADRIISCYLEENKINIPYIATMHGSHDRAIAKYSRLNTLRMLKFISQWVYIADKNLDFFDGFSLPDIVKFPNAMPIDMRAATSSRYALGIKDSDIVFSFAARGITEKGWNEITQAFILLQKETQKSNFHLILMGEGEAQKNVQKIVKGNKHIHFLGYESAVNGVLRYSDCFVLPSRFVGESYPLCLIQAIQEKLPCIATDIGEIKNMIKDNNQYAGILIENNENNEIFIENLKDAMKEMLNDEVRAQYKLTSTNISYKYDMKNLAEKYINLYIHTIQKYKEKNDSIPSLSQI